MNTTLQRIDRSVNRFTLDQGIKHSRDWVPLFPISTAEELKSTLVKRLSAEYSNVATRLVFQSVNEAYALATLSGEPLLLLPVLAEEKVQQASAWSARQKTLLHDHGTALAA
jgi:hypothetical protein